MNYYYNLSFSSDFVISSVWPDVWIKNIPNFCKRCPKSSLSCFYIIRDVFKIGQIVTKYLDYLVRIFCHHEFKKSPNLVTLALFLTLISYFITFSLSLKQFPSVKFHSFLQREALLMKTRKLEKQIKDDASKTKKQNKWHEQLWSERPHPPWPCHGEVTMLLLAFKLRLTFFNWFCLFCF